MSERTKAIHSTPIVTTKLDEFMTPGVMIEVDADQAEQLGLVEEPAVTADDAWDANGDPHRFSPE